MGFTMTSKKFLYFIWSFYFTLLLLSQNISMADDFTTNLPDISEKIDSKIDLNLKFTNDEGETKTIKDMFKDQSTLIITLNYFRCTTMCTYQFINLSDALKKSNMPVGKGYTVASISFDPSDDVAKAQTTRELWIKKLGTQNAPWHFYVSTNPTLTQELAKSLNFYFEKDDEGNYAHTAGLFFIDQNGTFKRYLYGIVYEPRDIKYALIDTSYGKIGSFFDKIVKKFSRYNVTRGRYELYGS